MSTTSNDVPLNPQYLLEALRAASSTSQEMVQQATHQLQQWEKVPGYWVMLQVSLFYYFLGNNADCNS